MADTCPGCRERDARIAELQRQMAELQVQLRDLQQRLGVDATNSSLPPSANPPDGRKPVVKTPTGRRPGGQPGHSAHQRLRLPPERVQHIIRLLPERCERCQTPLPTEPGPHDPEPTWHQVVELPRVTAVVTEYQGHARTCSGCGHVTHEEIPQEIRRHGSGERLAATLSYLSGCPHVSKRGVEEIVETVFGVPISLGTVANLEQEMSAALAPAHAEAQQAVQAAPAKQADETGWKQAGQPRWLWAAATATVACFVIHTSRGAAGLLALLGQKIRGIVASDRWSAYQRLMLRSRQICWAHLKRDFQKLVDRGGLAEAYGEKGLAAVAILFHEWHLFRGGGSRKQLQFELEPVRRGMRAWLEDGASCAEKKTARFCQNLLDLEPALWTFLYKRGVEPTNNQIERLLRSGVLWRKRAFGCHSACGCRFVERILTVTQTLRLQKRSVLDYLVHALQAHRAGQPAPKLLPAG
ncbi:MAG TPA: IS66 family transposase [Castellaniella sp.]|nr:IS66 family transposase [Castellaniella sp.]